MIKGSRKQLIVLRTGNSRYFDEAYFVLRRELEPARCKQGDILIEANRILQESLPERVHPLRRIRSAFWFLGGLLCGAAVCAAAFLIF